MEDTFIPYRERPPLDKGPKITWRELESGMLFKPGVSSPSLRRVRGTPTHIPEERAYLIGSEDEVDGRPTGGILGTDTDVYRRTYLPDGRPVYEVEFRLSTEPLPAHWQGD